MAVLALTVGALPANAHSRLISISPKDGETLAQSPTEVVLTFNEAVNPEFVTVRITDSEGADVIDAEPTADGPKVTLPVGEPIAAGTYKVVYRVVSADSHPISGSSTFTIEGNPQSPPASPSPTESASAASPSASAAATPSATPAAPDADASDEATDSDNTPIWVWVLVFAGLLAAIGATFYAVRRDNSQS